MIGFGSRPQKSLSEQTRIEVARLLERSPSELSAMFSAFEEIITAYSPEAQPLVDDHERRKTARKDLKRIIGGCNKLSAAIAAGGLGPHADEQIKLRIALVVGDFWTRLVGFRQALEQIDAGVAPGRGDAARVDRLRMIAYCCAIQYHAVLGKVPARRPGSKFHHMMDLVLSEIGLKLPDDPWNILKGAIDEAEKIVSASAQQQPTALPLRKNRAKKAR